MAENGYIALDLFLNCNKIKKMGVNKVSQLIEAAKLSSLLELNDKENLIRRKDNKALPGLKNLKRK